MFYKPTYCCHCGEKIENTESLPRLDSGRFCIVCRKELSFFEWTPRVFIIVCAVFGLFGVGSYLQSGDTARSAALKQNKTIAPARPIKNESGENPVQAAPLPPVQKSDSNSEPNRDVKDGKPPGEPENTGLRSTETEQVYFCGAETKKGTPCSRKVKGGGRCWQHKGQKASLAREKLSITQ